MAIYRFRQACFFHISIYTVNTFSKLFYEIVFIKQFNNLRISRKMKLPDIVYPNKTRKYSRAFHSKMVIKHFYLNICSTDTVITMCSGIHDQLGPTELWEFRNSLKYRSLTKFRIFPNLRFYKSYRFPDLIKNPSCKFYVFNHIHAIAYLSGFSFITDETDACPWKKTLRIGSKKKNRRPTHYLIIAM